MCLMNEVTRILSAIEEGDPQAAEQLLPLVYNELRNLAACRLAREEPGQTLDATALVHEAYLRLVGHEHSAASPSWNSGSHFFAAAAEAMRRILIDHARRKGTAKHGGGKRRVTLDDIAALATTLPPDNLLALNDALEKLAQKDRRKAELVKLRFFAGLTMPEAAAVRPRLPCRAACASEGDHPPRPETDERPGHRA